MEKIIIHISGASGSGKTFLGRQLKDKFKNKIIVKDLDDLRDEFIVNFYGSQKWTYIDEDEYQKYIDKFVENQIKNKPIVFVGLNDNQIYGQNKNLYFNLISKYNYYIDIDDKVIVKQKCLRFLNNIQNDEYAMNDLVNNNEYFIKMMTKSIKRECGEKETIKMNNKWKKDYIKQGYNLMSRENIYKEVCKILSK